MRTTTAGVPATSPTTADGTFVVVTENATLYARNASDGRVLWSGSQNASTEVTPVPNDGTVVAGDGSLRGIGVDTGSVHAIDPDPQ